MTPFDRHLLAAQGFLELGLPLDAHEELEDIEPELRTLAEVLMVRVQIYRVLGTWDLMGIVAKQLCKLRPDEPEWFIQLAYASRRSSGPPSALTVLSLSAY